MVIDLILDRKDGKKYNSKSFYNDVMEYGNIGWDITEAMDNGTEEDIQKAIGHYIVENGYNPKIIEYVYSVKWL